MIFRSLWSEWILRLLLLAALGWGVYVWLGQMPPWRQLWPFLGILGLVLIMEQRLRRHICWAVTEETDFARLRQFYQVDAAHRFLPLPSQRTLFADWAGPRTPLLTRLLHSKPLPIAPAPTPAPEEEPPAPVADLPEPPPVEEEPLPELDLDAPSHHSNGAVRPVPAEKRHATRQDLPSFPI